ncbi:MAG: type II secretion system F family protein [Sphingomonadaceae bacterium]
MDYRILFALLIFGAVCLLIYGAYLAWQTHHAPEVERLARRLRKVSVNNTNELAVSITKERVLSADPAVQRLLQRIPGIQYLDRLQLQTGRSGTTARLAGIMTACLLAGLVLGSALHLPWWGRLVAAGLCAALPVMEAARAKAKRLVKIEHQLPEALDLMGRAMRAGHAFPTALKMVGDEMPEPLAAEFRSVFDEVNFGIAMPDALMNLALRVPSTDLRYFVVAVLIQRETGGNLTDLLSSISAIIRDRLKLLGQVRVMSAEGRMSAWVLGCLPFAAAALMAVINPGFLDTLFTDPGGRKMVSAAGILMAIGVLVIRRITHIRV